VLREFTPKVKSSSILSEANNLINLLKKDIDPDVFIALNGDKI
jgi:exosome complex RNA-binding protein Rrp4